MPNPNFSIGIVTYNRPLLLARCLASIKDQSRILKRIILVDNDPQQSAQNIPRQFPQLPIKYVPEPIRNTPRARNQVLTHCDTDYLGFIDDDCVLEKDWSQQAKSIIKIWKKGIGFVTGRSKLLNNHSIMAQSQHLNMKHLFDTHINTSMSALPEALDTKNSIIFMKPIRDHRLCFDEQFGQFKISGSEDIDMGYQLQSVGWKGYYCPHLVVYHQEADTLLKIIKKGFYRGRLKYRLHRKWHINDAEANRLDLRLYPHAIHNIHELLGKLKYIGRRIAQESISPGVILAQEIHNLSLMQGFIYESEQSSQ